jgi:hypothetical protein
VHANSTRSAAAPVRTKSRFSIRAR